MKKNIIVKIALIASVIAIIIGVKANAEKVMENVETMETEMNVSEWKKYEDAIREDFPKLLSQASNGTYSTISQRFDWHEDQSITWTIVAYDHEMETWEEETVEIPGPAHLVLYQAEISEQLS